MLRWGLIGCGNVAERKGGPALYSVEDSQLVAVMSRDSSKARDFATRHGAQRYYDSVERLLADNDINAVYIATPVFLHCEYTILAAEAGKHVLCEKPMGMDLNQCQQMIDVCRKNQVSLMSAYYRRFFPNVIKMKELFESGAIGDIVLARIQNHAPFNFQKTDELPWRVIPEMSGGGVLMDLGSHRLDLLLFLFGEVDRINGHAARMSWEYPVDDSVTFEMRFRSGVHAIGDVHWNLPKAVDSLEVFGTRGKLMANPLNSGQLILENQNQRQTFSLPTLNYTHVGLIQNFVNHLKTGEDIVCSGEEGIKTNQLIRTIYHQSNDF